MVLINGYPSCPRTTKTNDGSRNNSVTVTVPTFKRKDDKNEVYLPQLRASDLQHLKAVDPFLYYSIPSVREQTLKLKDFSYEGMRIGKDHPRQNQAVRSLETGEVVLPPQRIDRKSRISFEGCIDAVFFEMMDDAEGTNRDRDEVGIPHDPIASLLFERKHK